MREIPKNYRRKKCRFFFCKWGKTWGAPSHVSQPLDCHATPRSSCAPVQGLGFGVALPSLPTPGSSNQGHRPTQPPSVNLAQKDSLFWGSSWPLGTRSGCQAAETNPSNLANRPDKVGGSPMAQKSTFVEGSQSGRGQEHPWPKHASLC